MDSIHLVIQILFFINVLYDNGKQTIDVGKQTDILTNIVMKEDNKFKSIIIAILLICLNKCTQSLCIQLVLIERLHMYGYVCIYIQE